MDVHLAKLCSLVLVEGSRLWLGSFMITCVSGIVLTCVSGRLETVARLYDLCSLVLVELCSLVLVEGSRLWLGMFVTDCLLLSG